VKALLLAVATLAIVPTAKAQFYSATDNRYWNYDCVTRDVTGALISHITKAWSFNDAYWGTLTTTTTWPQYGLFNYVTTENHSLINENFDPSGGQWIAVSCADGSGHTFNISTTVDTMVSMTDVPGGFTCAISNQADHLAGCYSVSWVDAQATVSVQHCSPGRHDFFTSPFNGNGIFSRYAQLVSTP
jgi:hypothetical protein